VPPAPRSPTPEGLSGALDEGRITVADRIALSDAGLRKVVAVAIVAAFVV
jgi:hypothetical protein